MDILKDIAYYFSHAYNGDDRIAEGLTITPEEMREVTAMHQELSNFRKYKKMVDWLARNEPNIYAIMIDEMNLR